MGEWTNPSARAGAFGQNLQPGRFITGDCLGTTKTTTMTVMTTPQNHSSPSILAAGIIASALEWYDFLLYADFAPIIAPLFCPAKTPFLSLLMAFGVFALGFLVRRVGAIVIGRWGDIYGRRKALIYTISLMTIPTVAI